MANWEAIGAIGEIAGSSAVLLSLIYIAVQLRDTKRNAARTAALELHQAMAGTVLGTPQIAEIIAKVSEVDGASDVLTELQTTYNLTGGEAVLYARFLSTGWRTLELDYLTRGEKITQPIERLLSQPSYYRLFETNNKFYDAGFVKFVESVRRSIRDKP